MDIAYFFHSLFSVRIPETITYLFTFFRIYFGFASENNRFSLFCVTRRQIYAGEEQFAAVLKKLNFFNTAFDLIFQH